MRTCDCTTHTPASDGGVRALRSGSDTHPGRSAHVQPPLETGRCYSGGSATRAFIQSLLLWKSLTALPGPLSMSSGAASPESKL